jgi:hypothetical protein
LLLGVALVAVATGCGDTGSPSNQSARVAALVALTNKVCHEALLEHRAQSDPVRQRDAAKLRALVREDRNLPRLHKLFVDEATRRKVQETFARITQGKSFGVLPRGVEPLEESYRANLRIYHDQKALGMNTCAQPPRAPISG